MEKFSFRKDITKLALWGDCGDPDYQGTWNLWAGFMVLWVLPEAPVLSPSSPPSSLYKREIRFAFKSLKMRDFTHSSVYSPFKMEVEIQWDA